MARTTLSSMRAVVALLALAPAPAFAHGGTWRADQVLVEPGNPDHVVLCSDAWGIIETKDHGATWAWTCAEAYGAVSINLERVEVALLPGGTLLAARGFDGVFRAKGSLCDASPIAFFGATGRCGTGDCIAADVTRGADAAGAVLVLTTSARATGGVANLLWHSPDAGDTWAPLADSFPSDVAANSIAVAPSDPQRIYAAALPPDTPGVRTVLHTEDGGATWTKAPPVDASGVPDGEAAPVLRIAAVHPTDARIVFFWLDYADTPLKVGQDRLLMSSDGGTTLKEAFQGAGNLPGFAFSRDGASVFVGGPADGVHRAKVAEIASNGASSFVQVSTKPAWGLAVTAQGLVAGHDDFGSAAEPRFSLGLSRDEGATFSPLMVICDVGMQACPTGTRGADQCPGQFYGPGNYQLDFPMGPRCVSNGGDAGSRPPGDAGATVRVDAGIGAGGGPAVDAGKPSTGPKVSAGCGCTLASEGDASPWRSAVLALGLAAAWRRVTARSARAPRSGA